MAKPVILTVDDEPQVLNAIERDLRRRFGNQYRVIKSTSGLEALQAVQELKRRNQMVALFLVDQRMPAMTGTEFLAEASRLYPDAGKVLLTAYADTAAAITSINTIGLDYYLMKPWDPPEEHLYPVLEDILEEWAVRASPPYEGIRVAGTLWSAASHNVKDFLSRNQIPYQWLDIEKDEQAYLMAEAVWGEKQLLPVVFFPDGSTLIDPTNQELAEKIGLQTRAAHPFYDLIIIGAGPAGLAAAVYGASEGLRTIMIEREASGGQAGTSSRIENYLGFPKGIRGADLARRAADQARRFGAEILTAQEAIRVRVDGSYKFVTLNDGSELSCHALLIATGVSVRKLEAPGCDRLAGTGVYYGAAISEAAAYRGQDIVIVGGANSAGQGAMFFSQTARRVIMLVRGSTLVGGMSRYLIDQVSNTPNIEIRAQTEVVEAIGKNRLEAVAICNRVSGATETIQSPAMFIFIGAVPRTDLVASLVEHDRAGFILTGPNLNNKGERPKGWLLKRDPYLLETSQPGIFAAGDVRHSSIKRVASAVGEGSVAVQLIHQYLRTV
jgi:thioredoxin reductase (NADPH)